MYNAESAHLYLHLLQLAEGQHQHLQLLRLKFFFILNTDQVDRIQGWPVPASDKSVCDGLKKWKAVTFMYKCTLGLKKENIFLFMIT